MKTLKQIREDYNAKNFGILPEELTLMEAAPKRDGRSGVVPSTKDMPQVLVFRRVSYRLYPGSNVVALYYSSALDKYLSIPFGPDGNLNLSEATIEEDWQKVNRQDKTDGLSQKAVNAYRRENPGSKLQTAVTEKNPTGKRADRRKNFCSRMSGMKKRLTSAETARDPDSRINKALRRWNCEESFQIKLAEARMQRNEGIASAIDKGADFVVPYYSATKKLVKGDLKGAAIDAGIDTAAMAVGGPIGKIGAKVLAKVAARKAAKTAAKAGASSIPRDASAIAGKAVAKKSVGSALKSGVKKLGGLAAGAAGAAASALAGAGDATAERSTGNLIRDKKAGGAYSSWDKSHGSDTPVDHARYKAAALRENKMADLREMIAEGASEHTLVINEREVTINTSMAKRILEVYDSVNTKNKRIVEGMLNSDLESFKKLLNFSIKQ